MCVSWSLKNTLHHNILTGDIGCVSLSLCVSSLYLCDVMWSYYQLYISKLSVRLCSDVNETNSAVFIAIGD